MSEFRGKVAFVSGAGSGMGEAMVHEFAARGADVVACDIDGEAADATAGPHGGLSVTADVADSTQVEAAVAAALERFGRIDILCSNAGMLDGYATALDTPEDVWVHVLRVNLTGTYLLVRAVLPGMLERGSGSVIT